MQSWVYIGETNYCLQLSNLLQELVNFVFKNKQTTTLYTTVCVVLYI